MSDELRVVFDTNVLISAVLIADSVPRKAFDLAAGRGTLLASEMTLLELDEVLRRPKLQKYVTEEQRLEFLRSFISRATLVEIAQSISASRDSADDKFLELAINGNASQIVTGDADLLTLNPFRGIQIVTPADFLKLGKKDTPSE